MEPLINRDALRYDPTYGVTRYRVPPRHRPRVITANMMETADEPTVGSERYARHFMTAFAGGLVFFSVMIF